MARRKLDLNEIAARIVQESTSLRQTSTDTRERAERERRRSRANEPENNPAAVALGRLGGLKGGKARAKKLSATARRRIARKATAARWKQ